MGTGAYGPHGQTATSRATMEQEQGGVYVITLAQLLVEKAAKVYPLKLNHVTKKSAQVEAFCIFYFS